MPLTPELYKQIPSCWFDFAPVYDEAVATAPPDSCLVECGSFWGQSAVYLAEAAKIADKGLKVYCVDIWGMTPQNNPPLFDPEAAAQGHIEPQIHAQFHNSVFETFAHYVDQTGLSPDPLRILRMPSLEAARFFTSCDNLHFVFLDNDHDYPYVFYEIHAWSPLIWSGGILAGHDWHPEFPGVQRSVEAYFGTGRASVECGRSWVVR